MDVEDQHSEMEEEMPPIDEELRLDMADMVQRQEKCFRLQKWLILLAAVCFWNVVGVVALFASVPAVGWAFLLAEKGETLVRKAYPWFQNIIFLYGRGRGNGPLGISAYERIEAEAKKTGDELTVRLLKFRGKAMGYGFGAMAAYIAATILVSVLGRLE